MKLWLTILFVVVAESCQPVCAQEDTAQRPSPFAMHGYLKYLEQVSIGQNGNQALTDQLVHNRLNFQYRPSDAWNFRVEVRNRLYFGQLVKDYPGFADLVTGSAQPISLSENWINRNSVLFNSTIDRASAEYNEGKWDITIGRQRINWGINTVWTPNDIFNTFNFFDFDYEERPGSDASRSRYLMNSASSVEVDLCPGKTASQDIGAVMYHLNKWDYDFQVFTGIWHTDYTAGAGWAGNLKSAGFKGEVTYFAPYGTNRDSASLVSSLTLDYGFKNGIYVLVSGLYNSLGNDSSINMVQLSSETLSAKNMFPFRYTGYVQAAFPLSPILHLSTGLMYSPAGNSVIFLPTLTWSVANNWVIDLVVQSFAAKQNNSYSVLGNSCYARVKWGF